MVFKVRRKFVIDLFTSDVKVSAEHSDKIFNIFDGIVLKKVAFLL